MKELVYKTPLDDEHELVARIIIAAAANNSRRPHVMFKNVESPRTKDTGHITRLKDGILRNYCRQPWLLN